MPTTLAVYWAEKLMASIRSKIQPGDPTTQWALVEYMVGRSTAQEKVQRLQDAVAELTRDFGTWKTPWGEINRFQRLTGKVQEEYDDQKASIPVGFTASMWGSLAAFGARTAPNTKKRYGYVGNSFVAVVEFGEKVRARSIVTGGSSSNPASPHFNDQSQRYTAHQFKDVLFYKEDVMRNAERTYHPE